MGSALDSRKKKQGKLYNTDPLLYGDLYKGQFPTKQTSIIQTLSNTEISLRDSSLLNSSLLKKHGLGLTQTSLCLIQTVL